MELFDGEWAFRWALAIRESEGYRQAGATWRQAIALEVIEDGRSRAVWADLFEGTCREAREASPEDLASAPVVLSGERAVWDDLVAGRQDALVALMSGRLRVGRGSLFALMPYAQAAKELVLAARRASTTTTAQEEA
ncbi:MAG TPA: Fis family transcriptional regulator [Thermoanaerobaculia bacterium]|nr:Fis family transcriptional regulator [Thermoanaerobaculia bacterium]